MLWIVHGRFFSKKHILANPKTGFLVVSLDKNLWRGKATYAHYAREGPEYDYYNNVPMFRFNAYFGVQKVRGTFRRKK